MCSLKPEITIVKFQTKHLVSILIFILLCVVIIFVSISSYKLYSLDGKQDITELSFSMLQLFIAIFGITLAIIGFWSYSSIKDHAVSKTTELTTAKFREYDKVIDKVSQESLKNLTSIKETYAEVMKDLTKTKKKSKDKTQSKEGVNKRKTEGDMENE